MTRKSGTALVGGPWREDAIVGGRFPCSRAGPPSGISATTHPSDHSRSSGGKRPRYPATPLPRDRRRTPQRLLSRAEAEHHKRWQRSNGRLHRCRQVGSCKPHDHETQDATRGDLRLVLAARPLWDRSGCATGLAGKRTSGSMASRGTGKLALRSRFVDVLATQLQASKFGHASLKQAGPLVRSRFPFPFPRSPFRALSPPPHPCLSLTALCRTERKRDFRVKG